MHRGATIRTITTALTTFALAATGLVATAGVANAEDGLAVSGSSTYVATDDGKPVKVTQTVTVTHQKPSTDTMYYYFTGYSVWLPNKGSNISVTSNGGSIPFSIVTDNGQEFVEVTFPASLMYGQSKTFTISYTVPGAPPRSDRPGRVGQGYASIDVVSPGDPGQATITIVAPKSMAVHVQGDFTHSLDGGTRTTTITGGGVDGLWSPATLRDDSKSLKKKVKVDDLTFTLVAFPGDKEWVDHITQKLPGTLRALEELIGQDWPTKTTTITEDASQLVYGWEGTYEHGNITVSEALDPALLAHELSHAWANYDTFEESWLTEGLAQELTTQVMRTTKGEDEVHEPVTPTDENALPLAEWTTADGGPSATVTEDYAYPASWQVVHSLFAGSTPGVGRELVRALTSQRSIYDVAGEKPLVFTGTGWEQAYDLFAVMGENPQTDALMKKWVLTPEDAATVKDRQATRRAYAAGEEVDGEWALPRGVRSAMARWNFPRARTLLEETKALSESAADAQAAATQAQLDAKGIREAYEQADASLEYTEVADQLTSFTTHAGTYGTLRDDVAGGTPFARLGALLLQPDADLDEAAAALAEGDVDAAGEALGDAESAADLSTLTGVGIIAGILALLAGLILGWRRRRR